MRIECRIGCWLLCFAALIQAGCQAPASPIQLSIDGHQINAEVAVTPKALATGLMRRDRLTENAGMLFVLPQTGLYCMWMKDTRIPLSVAFLDADGWVVNIVDDMQPGSLDQHCATRPARYALEMNKGWFARHASKPGTRVFGLKSRP